MNNKERKKVFFIPATQKLYAFYDNREKEKKGTEIISFIRVEFFKIVMFEKDILEKEAFVSSAVGYGGDDYIDDLESIGNFFGYYPNLEAAKIHSKLKADEWTKINFPIYDNS